MTGIGLARGKMRRDALCVGGRLDQQWQAGFWNRGVVDPRDIPGPDGLYDVAQIACPGAEGSGQCGRQCSNYLRSLFLIIILIILTVIIGCFYSYKIYSKINK